MDYLVIDLERNCINDDISTINLLRKALVVAKKLRIANFEVWIKKEMEGYKNDDDIPEYRKVKGRLMAWNPYNGWIPTILSNDTSINEMLTSMNVWDSVSNIEYLMKSDGNNLCREFSGNIENELGKMFDFKTKYGLFVDKAQFKGILESIRNTILNWALQLESDGVLGQEMIFNDKEKEIAENKNYTVNNFFGNITNSQIQQDVTNSKQKKLK